MTEFPVIDAFLRDFPFDVAPRSSADLSDDMRSDLHALSNGESAGKDLEALSRDILENPEALEYLATLAREKQAVETD